MSLERYVLINLMTDLSALGLAARSCGLFAAGRFALAALICFADVCAGALWPFPFARPLWTLISMALSCTAMCRSKPDWLKQAGRLFLRTLAAMTLFAGAALFARPAARPSAVVFSLPMGGAAYVLLLRARRRGVESWTVRMQLLSRGRVVRFEALIDTGNRLREPLSGLPVLVVDAALIAACLPEEGYRLVPYGAVGGCGTLRCFRPEGLTFDDGQGAREAPPLWVAASPNSLRGAERALAPVCFADLVRPSTTINARRLCSWH